MEHDFGFLKRDDSSADPENDDFTSYLNRKVDECIKEVPASQISEIPLLPSNGPEPVKGAEEISSTSQKSTTGDTEGWSTSYVAPVAEGRETKLNVRGVEGHKYVTETTEAVSVDSEWIRVRDESRQLAVVDMTAEQVIQRFHSLDRLVFLTRAQQQGLRDALEELLKTESSARRVELLEMDRKFKVKQARKSIAGKSKKASGISAESGLNKKQRTAIDVLISFKVSKDMVVDKLKTMGLLDDRAERYVEKLFA